MTARNVSPTALMDQITAGDMPVVLDVRSKAEFNQGHVPGAIHFPFWRVESRWRELGEMRDRPLVVYCGHGPRAYLAGAALQRHGFSHVMYLEGHMRKWKQMSLPLEVST